MGSHLESRELLRCGGGQVTDPLSTGKFVGRFEHHRGHRHVACIAFYTHDVEDDRDEALLGLLDPRDVIPGGK
jgi:hypothetical protein